MHAVVSLLDAEHCARVEALCAQIGLRGAHRAPFPHFSYHVAGTYDLDAAERALKRLARRTAAFPVRAGGLGIFTGAAPVVHVPVVRSDVLREVHAAVWSSLVGLAGDVVADYESERWMPHITLAAGEVDLPALAGIVARLGALSLEWTIRIDTLAIIEDRGDRHVVRSRFSLA